MKICIVCSSLAVGGSTEVVLNLCDYLKAKGNDVYLISLWDDAHPKYKRRIENLNLIYDTCKKNGKFDFFCYKRLRRLISIFKPDLINTHLTSLFYCYLANTKIPIYHTIHCDPKVDIPLIYRIFMKKAISKNSIHFIACSESIKTASETLYKKPIFLAKNGLPKIDLSSYDKNKQYDILFVGRFDPIKNINDLLKAFSLCVESNSDLKLCVCGVGKMPKEEIEKCRNLSSNIDIIISPNDVNEFYAKSRLFCLFSSSEGGPICILEALRFGLPCICSNIPGTRNYINDGFNGLLFDVHDYKKASEQILFLLTNPEHYEHFSNNAYKSFEEYTFDQTGYQYERIFNCEKY